MTSYCSPVSEPETSGANGCREVEVKSTDQPQLGLRIRTAHQNQVPGHLFGNVGSNRICRCGRFP